MKKILRFKPEGETDKIELSYGHTCGKQEIPSIGLSLPDTKRRRHSVLTFEQVDDLIDYLSAHRKKWKKSL